MALLDSARQEEQDLAAAITGRPGALTDPGAVAALLRLAEANPLRSALAIGLRAAFLDDDPADRAAAFADVYRRLALPGLGDRLREHSAPLLDRL